MRPYVFSEIGEVNRRLIEVGDSRRVRVGQKCRTPDCSCWCQSDLIFLGEEPGGNSFEGYTRVVSGCGVPRWVDVSHMNETQLELYKERIQQQ